MYDDTQNSVYVDGGGGGGGGCDARTV